MQAICMKAVTGKENST